MVLLAFWTVLLVPGYGRAATLLVEAEAFSQLGGWQVDQLAMDVMGSPYVLAHGLGVPVADATTKIVIRDPGRYRVFVRTKDWVARWKAPGTPGRFQLLIDGRALAATFGTQGSDWFWHDGGIVRLDAGEATLALHDLTGFEGRCDAVLLSSDADFVPPNEPAALAAFRRKLLGLPAQPDEAGRYDLVVAGGGMAGCCTAVAAARLGLKVALLQDRPVLGGNSSSEIRVWINGRFQLKPYPLIGEIVSELYTRPKASPGEAREFGDERKLQVLRAEPNVRLFLWQHVNGVEMEGRRMRAVLAAHVLSGRQSRFTGRWFADCTGDASVGRLAGADSEMAASDHQGSSNLWKVEDCGKPVSFPRCPWALDLRDKPFPSRLGDLGIWFWESGFDRDTIGEAEAIRDHNLRAMYGAWDCLKNVKRLYPNHRLAWAAYISGKRESARLLGDVILSTDDILAARPFPDACVPATWSIDLHGPHPQYAAAAPDNPFISEAKFTHLKAPYPIPFRCLYSRNIANLMMAGRDISVTHEALGTVRVMATGGMMGEVLGRAAFLCKKYDTDPRDVYGLHLDEFQRLLTKSTLRK
ncbi:MAG: FAD-dependent oxidoreductase [Thermoguttaceae bacterium]|jgi:hypothetical protein